MAFWNSDLLKNLEKGELPVIRTEVELPRETLVNLGLMVMIVAVGITALVVTARLVK